MIKTDRERVTQLRSVMKEADRAKMEFEFIE